MPLSVELSNKELIKKRLLKKRNIDENGCWIFIGGLDENGYGIITIEFHSYRVHRVSAYIYLDYDILFDSRLILHKRECNNPSCFNPEHLYIGTHQENVHDSIARGTHNTILRAPKTHCKHGHLYDEENTHIDKKGIKRCRKCHNGQEKIRGKMMRDLYGG